MDILNCNHDKVQTQLRTCNGSVTLDAFINHLFKEDYRLEDEHNRAMQLQGNYDEADILDPENMDNVEIALHQWYQNNPGWW